MELRTGARVASSDNETLAKLFDLQFESQGGCDRLASERVLIARCRDTCFISGATFAGRVSRLSNARSASTRLER